MSRVDSYRAEATRSPFTISLDDGSLLSIEQPAFDQLLAACQLANTRARLLAIGGNQVTRLLEAVAEDDCGVALAVAADVWRHFGGPDVGRLVWLLDRYGDAIEADLRPKGIDFLDLWRDDLERPLSPRTLLNLIDRLPRTSHYQEALAQDEELADGTVDAPPGQPKPPPLTEFTPEVEALAVVVERLGELINTTYVVAGGKARPAKPWPRPVTAADRIKARRRKEAMDDLEQQLFPRPGPADS